MTQQQPEAGPPETTPPENVPPENVPPGTEDKPAQSLPSLHELLNGLAAVHVAGPFVMHRTQLSSDTPVNAPVRRMIPIRVATAYGFVNMVFAIKHSALAAAGSYGPCQTPIEGDEWKPRDNDARSGLVPMTTAETALYETALKKVEAWLGEDDEPGNGLSGLSD